MRTLKKIRIARREDKGGKGFKLNGVNKYLHEIARDVVLDFANNNTSMNAQQIRDYFVNMCKGIGISHIVETETEYHLRDGQSSQERSVSEITIPSGEKLFVSTQWRAKNNEDNFIKFMDLVNDNGLGIITRQTVAP